MEGLGPSGLRTRRLLPSLAFRWQGPWADANQPRGRTYISKMDKQGILKYWPGSRSWLLDQLWKGISHLIALGNSQGLSDVYTRLDNNSMQYEMFETVITHVRDLAL